MSKIITQQSDIAEATTEDLVATYNALTGKSIKKFETRAVAEVRVANAMLASADRVGHAGVPKGAVPKAMPLKEVEKIERAKGIASPPSEDEGGEPDQPNQQESLMSKTTKQTEDRDAIRAQRYPHAAAAEAKAKAAAKKAGAAAPKTAPKAAPKAAAKKASAKAAGKPEAPTAAAPKAKAQAPARAPTYTHIRLGKPDPSRRNQEGSKRTAVLRCIQDLFAKNKGLKVLAVDEVSKKMGFDVRSYVHKLAGTAHVEIAPAPKAA